MEAKHESAASPAYGVDVASGEIKDMLESNVLEPLRVKRQVVKSATEAANMILKIDDLMAAKGIRKGGEKTPKEPS